MRENYREFYKKYKDKLFSYLMYVNGNPELSKDIMQESFARYLKQYGSHEAGSPALLYTIARNALYDEHRLRKRSLLSFYEEQLVVPDEEVSLERREECERVKELMEKLPQEEQEILVLAVGGVRYKEIAVILGTSEANIKVKVHRARCKLRQMFNEGEV